MQGNSRIFVKNLALPMIRYTPASERTLALFKTPFEQSLDPNNRWIRAADSIPWDHLAKCFFDCMSPDQGRGTVDLRVVIGALLVKHIEGLSDEDTIVYIQENIYAQFFVGLPSFQKEPVFEPSLFVAIRKRLNKLGAMELNDSLMKEAKRLKAIRHRAAAEKNNKKDENKDDEPPTKPDTSQQELPLFETDTNEMTRNRGTLKLDATVAPQHIGYPTDVRLLHEARLNSEMLLDKLFSGTKLWKKKPRTYRIEAKDEYLSFAKTRRPNKKTIRKARGKQLRYLNRNLKHINKMLDQICEQNIACPWKHKDWQRFWVLVELHRQQDLMHRDGRKRVDDRIVNIAQPYVRPIQRGKAGKPTEFGAKLNMSETEGFVRMDQIDFDNYNEGLCLKDQIERYKRLFGYYPELVLVDKIYLNRENRNYMKSKGIRHAGPPLGKQPEMSRAEKLKRKKEQNKRSEIEGKFGQAKSKYNLDNIPTKRKDTSYAYIGLILLALNVLQLSKSNFLFIFNNILMQYHEYWYNILNLNIKNLPDKNKSSYYRWQFAFIMPG